MGDCLLAEKPLGTLLTLQWKPDSEAAHPRDSLPPSFVFCGGLGMPLVSQSDKFSSHSFVLKCIPWYTESLLLAETGGGVSE